MNRRDLVKLGIGAAAMEAIVRNVPGQSPPITAERSYNSATISVRLVEADPGKTAVLLTEHGDADYVIVEAFYWTIVSGLRVMLHKETTTPILGEEATMATDLAIPLASIVFLRVKEMKMLKQSEFGEVPGEESGILK